MSETAIGVQSNPAAGRARVGFFTAAATLMAVIVFVAFSRTFYLRPLFETTDLSVRLGQDGLPFHLILHGLALSLWYALFCLQAWLIALRSVRFHRQIGYFGIAAASAVIISGTVTTIRFVPRRLTDGGDYSMFSGIVVGNFLSLLVFSALIWLAIYWGRRVNAHRRLMFLASVAILGPAFGGVRNRVRHHRCSSIRRRTRVRAVGRRIGVNDTWPIAALASAKPNDRFVHFWHSDIP